MSLFQPTTSGELIRRNEKRLNRLERRTNWAGQIAGLEADVATLEAEVAVLKAKTNDKPEITLRIPLPLNVTIRPRAAQTSANPINPTIPFWITKNSAGVVTFEGLGSGMANMAAGTTFATLPAGYRPAQLKRFPIMFNGGRSSVVVNTNGTMTLGANVTATSDYFSLANAWFYEASIESSFTWNTPTLLNSWTVSAGLTPQWAVDPYGCIITRGRAAKAGTWTNSNPIFTVPGYNFSRTEIVSASSDSSYGFARVGGTAGGAGNNVMSSGAVAGGALSLDGIISSPDTLDSNYSEVGSTNYTQVYGDITPSNGWVNYNASYRNLAAWLRPDGLILLRGLISTGTLGLHAVLLPTGLHPWSMKAWDSPANDAFGRLDMWSDSAVTVSAYKGGLAPMAGSATWFAVDSKVVQRGA